MRLNVDRDMLFLFVLIFIVGTAASAETEQTGCALKVFVNDPYAQIFVDDRVVGSPPQVIACSEREKNIVVRSSDGQIFSRLLTSKNNFDLANSTLNVVFHKKMSDFEFQAGASPIINAAKVRVTEESSTAAIELQSSLRAREIGSISSARPVTRLAGVYVQIFALKNFDMSKIEQDISHHYNGRIPQQEITVCPWQRAHGTQMLSLVLVGPFTKSAALAAKNSIGGKSFLVTHPTCKGELTKVSR